MLIIHRGIQIASAFLVFLCIMSKFNGKKSPKLVVCDKISRTQSTEPVDMAKALSGMQSTLIDIQQRLIKIEHTKDTVDDIRCDIYVENGIQERLDKAYKVSTENGSEIDGLREENRALREEIDLLRNVVIRMDRKMNDISTDVIQLRGRSMRDNILIHGFAQFPYEDLYKSVPDAIKKNLGVDHVKFAVIHRNGNPNANGKPVSITGKLVDRNKKFELLKAQRLKKNARVQIPFYITAQEPEEVTEERKRLYNVSDKFRKEKITTRVVKNQLVMPSGETYKEKVRPVSNADILSISNDAYAELLKTNTVITECIERKESLFFGIAGTVKSEKEVNNVYKKACLHNDSASSDHRILVYRFHDQSGKQFDGYHDDGEHGAGRRLLKFMKENLIDDTAIVISRWVGRDYLGFERFQIMENVVKDAVRLLRDQDCDDMDSESDS